MFRPQMLAIFRLYKGNLSVIHASVGGVLGAGGRYKCEISRVWGGLGALGLGLGWLGTICRQSTMPTYV